MIPKNDELEELIKSLDSKKLDIQNITTGVEFETGRIIDGKKEYGKRIDCGNMPEANTYKEVATGLSNVNYLHLEGMATNGSFFIPINCTRPADGTDAGSIGAYINNNILVIQTKSDRNSFTGKITIYYTKN